MTLSNPTRASRSAKLSAAYSHLGVSANDVLLAPKVTPFLAELCGDSNDAAGIKAAITYLRASSEPAARAFILMYDDPTLPGFARRALPLEAFCVAAKLDPMDLLPAITRVIHVRGAMLGAVAAARKHEAIVKTSLEVAETPEGIEDRMANLKHMGYLPSPRGAQVNVQVNANATANAAAKSDGTALASPEATIRKIVEARQQRMLPQPATGTPQLAEESASANAVPAAFTPRSDRIPVTVDAEYEDVSDEG